MRPLDGYGLAILAPDSPQGVADLANGDIRFHGGENVRQQVFGAGGGIFDRFYRLFSR